MFAKQGVLPRSATTVGVCIAMVLMYNISTISIPDMRHGRQLETWETPAVPGPAVVAAESTPTSPPLECGVHALTDSVARRSAYLNLIRGHCSGNSVRGRDNVPRTQHRG